MISNSEIMDFVAEEISTDTEINVFCNDKYNKDILVMVGVDVNKPPEIIDFPVFIIEPTQKSVSDSESQFDYEMVTHLAIKGNEKPEKTSNVIRYSGVYDIEFLGNLIVERIKNSISCKTNLEAYNIDFYHDEIGNFPVYSGVVVISFKVPNVIGENKINFN